MDIISYIESNPEETIIKKTILYTIYVKQHCGTSKASRSSSIYIKDQVSDAQPQEIDQQHDLLHTDDIFTNAIVASSLALYHCFRCAQLLLAASSELLSSSFGKTKSSRISQLIMFRNCISQNARTLLLQFKVDDTENAKSELEGQLNGAQKTNTKLPRTLLVENDVPSFLLADHTSQCGSYRDSIEEASNLEERSGFSRSVHPSGASI